MRYFGSSIAVCCFLLAANAAQDDAAKKDRDSLQGSWLGESITEGGKAIAEADVKGFKLTFKGNKVVLQKRPDEKADEAPFKLDPSKKPKAIDITVPEGPDKGTTILGIYSLEGNKLKICFAAKGERPSEFKAPKGAILFELKREKP